MAETKNLDAVLNTKAAEKKEETKTAAKKATTTAKKATTTKKTETTAAAAKKTTTAAKKTTTTKKATTAKKTTASAAKKASTEIFVEFGSNQVNLDSIIAKVEEDLKAQGVASKDVQLYVKPQDNKCYYAANKDSVHGNVDLF